MANATPSATAATAEQRSGGRGRWVGAGALLVLATLAAYWPALHGGFIWDDDSLLTKNSLIKAGNGLHRFWFTTEPIDYWPVTSTTFWLEWRLWGLHAAGYHATNLALHMGEALMLWAVLRRLEIAGAYVAAFLFAVHPVNVESVAWIAERKNLMAMLFFLASIWCILIAERPSPKSRWYWLSLLSFILAMLSKGSVAILPVLLLGLMAWRRPLTKWDGWRMAPFFAVAAVLGFVNVWFQKHYLMTEVVRSAGWLERLLAAGAVVWFYLGKALLPLHLVFVYPQWRVQVADPIWWVPLLAVIAFTGLLWRYRRRCTRPALYAWGYFCVALLPVLGFTDVYFMKYSLVADRYQHLAILGVVAFAGWAWSQWRTAAAVKAIAAGAAICALGGLTWSHCQWFRDDESLFTATLEENPGAWMAQINLGLIQLTAGQIAEAQARFLAALQLNPNSAEAHNDLGLTLFQSGRTQEAVAQFSETLRLVPNYPQAYSGLGLAAAALGQPAEAVADFERALQLKPDFREAYNNLGLVLVKMGRLSEAQGRFEAAIRIDPTYVEACSNLGSCLLEEGNPAAAIAWYQRALSLDPHYERAQYSWGYALRQLGRPDEARAHFEAAERLKANSGTGTPP